jgi:hypothetical protein
MGTGLPAEERLFNPFQLLHVSAVMRRVLASLLLLLLAAPAAGQVPFPAAPVATWPAPYVPWQPAAPYVTAGQDEPGYRRWIAARPFRSAHIGQFHRYLDGAGVAFVVPTWQLLRTASDWQRCGAEPFDVPPLAEWANVVQTLRYLRDYVIPVVGPVEPVSAYRNPLLNRCAGGAANSVHQHLSAIDLVPLRPISRDGLMRQLCAIHALEGPRYNVGLGFYSKLRFHVDSWRFRTWGRNDSGALACPRSYELAHRPTAAPVAAAAAQAAQPQSQPVLSGPPPSDPLAPRP